MGTSIDDHIKILKSYYNGFTGQASNLQESINVAVDIMSKYQKIEKIVKEWEFNHESMVDSMEKISEVVKDAKV